MSKVDLKNPHAAFVDVLKDACRDDGRPLSQLYNYFQDLIMCMPGNVYWMDSDCRTVGCNQNVLDMFGLATVDSFRGLSFDEMGKIGNWTAQQGLSFERDTREVLNTGRAKANVEEPPIPGPDGKPIYFLTTRVPLLSKSGEVLGVVGVSIDITHRKIAEQELIEAKEAAEKANAAKDSFIMNMEHDFRTPFNGICGIASLLWEEEEDPRKKEMLGMIMSSGKELLDYCSSIVDFSRIESGMLPVYEKRFCIKELLDRVITTEYPAAIHRGLTLDLNVDENLPESMYGDDFRLSRILINLISNAIKFTPSGGVSVSATLIDYPENSDRREAFVTIEVADTGLGIQDEQKNFIFEKFSRLTESGRSNARGLGLGLRIVRQFTAEMGGEIDVDSAPNKGSTFSCTFPFRVPLKLRVMGS